MIHCERYQPTGTVDTIPQDQVASLLTQRDILLWLDIERPTEEELAWLAATFQFHELAMEDVRNQRQRAKVDRYDAFFYVVLYAIHYHERSHRIDSMEIDFFLGANYLVTVHREPIPALQRIHQRWKEARLLHANPVFLFYLVADGVVDSYFPIIDEIGELIDELDNKLFAHPEPAVLKEIFTLRRSLLTVRKILGPTRDALNELIRIGEDERVFVSVERAREYFADIFDHVLRLTDFVDTYRDMLSSSLDAYQSSLSNKLNENMQLLTVAATVLATATVITGFYGMNLRGMMINSPWPFGGHVIFIILVIVTVIELWLFRRRGWL